MVNTKNIIWLASYPKSGNTWFRLVLANLQNPSDTPVNINHVEGVLHSGHRNHFDNIVGIDSTDLTFDEIDNLRPDVYRAISREHPPGSPLFMKMHDARTLTPKGAPLVPADVTRGVIYFIRNPLDVVMSLANHSGIGIDEAIANLNDAYYCLSGDIGKFHFQLRQKLLTWSSHVRGWTQSRDMNIHVVRYEDMKRNPMETFTKAAAFAGLEFTPEQMEKALEFSDFSQLKRQEQEDGFQEKSPHDHSFFYRGEAGYWREALKEEQVKSITGNHFEMMRKFGYLNAGGETV